MGFEDTKIFSKKKKKRKLAQITQTDIDPETRADTITRADSRSEFVRSNRCEETRSSLGGTLHLDWIAPTLHVATLVVDNVSTCSRLFCWYFCILRCVPSACRRACDARHHGWSCGSGRARRHQRHLQVLGVQNPVVFPQVQFSDLVVVPVVCNDTGYGPDSAKLSRGAAVAVSSWLWTSLC